MTLTAEEMALKTGDSVTAVVKATELMIAKPQRPPGWPLRLGSNDRHDAATGCL